MTGKGQQNPRIGTPAALRLSGCGCLVLSPGIVCVALGTFLLVTWHYGNYNTLEYTRGGRIGPAIDFSRPGIQKRQFSEIGIPRSSLNLCFCEKNGPDVPPPPDVLRRLRFDVCIKDSKGTVLISSKYRGDGIMQPVRVIDLQEIRPEMVDRLYDDTLQVEVDNLEVVEEMREVPVALYFARRPWERGGMPRLFGNLVWLLPGVLLVTLGIIQLTVWAILGRITRRNTRVEKPERS